MEKYNRNVTCERCWIKKKCANVGIPGINNYFICEPCNEKLTPEENERLSQWLVDNA